MFRWTESLKKVLKKVTELKSTQQIMKLKKILIKNNFTQKALNKLMNSKMNSKNLNQLDILLKKELKQVLKKILTKVRSVKKVLKKVKNGWGGPLKILHL